MPDRSVYNWTNIGISICGGLAAAAVFAVLTKGTLAGLALAHLAPLPIVIVALGLGVRHGASAAIVGTIALSFWPHYLFGMAYGLLVALPAWLGCYAAAGAPWGRRDLLSVNLSAWAVTAISVAIIGALVLFLSLAYFSHGAIDQPLAYVQGQFYFTLDQMMKERKPGEGGPTAEELTRFVKLYLPAVFATYALLLQCFNLWAGARLTQISGMLKLQWPDIAADFRLPRAVAVLFALATGLSFMGGFLGAAALVAASVLGMALGFQGLAVAHFWVRGSKSGTLTLAILYFFLGLLGLPMILLTLLGLADTALRFRERKSVAPRPADSP
ncbi:DUF2232 domain-containing protein [Methylocystis heyeri]|uniref:DUF2232 domain-containing protein n=1 Tax=Methylocystis heyeri TaxID=391905 RepID=UPI00138A33D9|nr:DUF2232 domain-containing protein [Methylocystis heyeri]